MADQQPQLAAEQTDAAAAGARGSTIRLPPFWSRSLLAWVRAAEAQFVLRNVTSSLEKYYLVLIALSEDQVDRVQAIVEAEATEESYVKLWAALLATHTLNPYQQVDLLVNMEPLGGRKPSDLLAAMEKVKSRTCTASTPTTSCSSCRGRSGYFWPRTT
jgi:hypothetical protein